MSQGPHSGPPPAFSNPGPPPPKKKKGGGCLIGLVLVFLLVGGLGGAWVGYAYWWVPMQAQDAVADAQAAGADAVAEAQEQAAAAQEAAAADVVEASEQADEVVAAAAPPPEPAPEEPAAEPAEAEPAAAETEEPAPAETAEAEPAETAEAEPAPAEAEAQPAAPSIAVGEPNPSAPRPRTLESRVRAEVRSAARQCYVQNGASGPVTVQVSVSHDGRVSRSRVVNDGTGNTAVARCISAALVGRRVGSPSGRTGTTINVTFSR